MVQTPLLNISEDVTGLELRGMNSGGSGQPRIICLDTTSCFADITQVLSSFEPKQLITTEELNSGIHGQMYARPRDTLVMRTDYWARRDVADVARHLLDLNSRIWHFQTGLSLLTLKTGAVSFVAPSESMLENAVDLLELKPGRIFLASNVTPRLVTLLGAQQTELAGIARTCELLNHKNTCMDILAAHGIRVPRTLPVNEPLTGDADTDDILSKLPPTNLYVLKADGSSGGVGVYTNRNNGYGTASLRRLITDLRRKHRLPTRFQIQEFVGGTSMGALAVFDKDERFNLSTVHVQGVQDGTFTSGHWRRETYDSLLPIVAGVYNQLSLIPGLCLRGPIGIDFKIRDGDIFVVEVNARMTGCCPIPWLLAHLPDAAKIDSIDLLTQVQLRAEDVAGDLLFDVVREIVSNAEARLGIRKPMILPQGLDPSRPSRIIFINDLGDELKRTFFEKFANSEKHSFN